MSNVVKYFIQTILKRFVGHASSKQYCSLLFVSKKRLKKNLTMKLRVFYSFPGLSSCHNFAIPPSFSIINILAVKYIKFAKLQPNLIIFTVRE